MMTLTEKDWEFFYSSIGWEKYKYPEFIDKENYNLLELALFNQLSPDIIDKLLNMSYPYLDWDRDEAQYSAIELMVMYYDKKWVSKWLEKAVNENKVSPNRIKPPVNPLLKHVVSINQTDKLEWLLSNKKIWPGINSPIDSMSLFLLALENYDIYRNYSLKILYYSKLYPLKNTSDEDKEIFFNNAIDSVFVYSLTNRKSKKSDEEEINKSLEALNLLFDFADTKVIDKKHAISSKNLSWGYQLMSVNRPEIIDFLISRIDINILSESHPHVRINRSFPVNSNVKQPGCFWTSSRFIDLLTRTDLLV